MERLRCREARELVGGHMGTVNIEPIVFLYLLIFIIPILVLNRYFGIRKNVRMLTAIGRMVVQLTLVGLFLQYVFALNNVWINLLYIIVMMLVASFSAILSCKINLKKYIIPMAAAFIVPNFIIMLFFNHLLLKLPNIFDARNMIAIQGMILGNSLSGIVIGFNQFYSSIQEDEKSYFQMLAISCSRRETLKTYYKKAILSTLNPIIATVETTGLVALPGMMTGQILGGTTPIVAIKYQIAIMLAILAARYLSVLAALWLTSLRAFDEYDVLSL